MTLFKYLGDLETNGHVEAYEFNDNGDVDYADIVELFRSIEDDREYRDPQWPSEGHHRGSVPVAALSVEGV